MLTREIITIQLGHYSNYVGAHWWNLQEKIFSYDPTIVNDINHDVLYREGETLGGDVTFTPRLLLADLKGSLGYLNEKGSLYNDPEETESSSLWNDDNLEVTADQSVPKPPFIKYLDESGEPTDQLFNFEDEVNSWVDYLTPRFHPRTVNTIKQYTHQCPNQSFDIFHYGRNLWQSDQFVDEFSDKIRQYAEECDLMQGFQILMDSTDGFAGLGASCVEHLRDEYGKSILVFPIIEPGSNKVSSANLIKAVNTAFSWQNLGQHASLFSPLCCNENGWLGAENFRKFDYLSYNSELKYHTSALLASALDTLSLRYRHKKYTMSALSDLCADLNQFGRKAAATSLSLPFPMMMNKDLIDVLDDVEGSLWTSLSPSCEIASDQSMHSLALRGISQQRLKRPISEAKKQMTMPAYKCSTVHEMMTMYLAYSCHASPIYLTTIDEPLKLPVTFPKIFSKNVYKNGDVAAWPVGEDVKSVPIMAGLHSGKFLGGMFESLHTQVAKIKNIKKFHVFEDSGLEQDDFNECLNSLLVFKEAYEDIHL